MNFMINVPGPQKYKILIYRTLLKSYMELNRIFQRLDSVRDVICDIFFGFLL